LRPSPLAGGTNLFLANLQRLEVGLDLGAARLEERRQGEPLAECLKRLVSAEARPVGGDLK
jgi:hypothetical protein